MRWLFGDGSPEDRRYAGHVLGLLEEAGSTARVPSLWGLEVANVVARAELQGLVSEACSAEFLAVLQDMAIEPDPETFPRALDTALHPARRHGLSAYDAACLELSLREGLPLATLDRDLRRAVDEAGGARA